VRVAIPTFGSEVSPRFCFAAEVVVVEVAGAREVARATLVLGDTGYPDRLRLLASRGVTLLVCGGFDRAFLGEAERAAIHVIWGVTGPVEDAVRAIVAGEPSHPPSCWCRARDAGSVASSTGRRARERRRAGNPLEK
jgi:predicted Fe-Mo cluster-binding NifX family protein